MLWRMNQEKCAIEETLKGEHDRRTAERDQQFEEVRAALETKLNAAREDFDRQVEDLISEHEHRCQNLQRAHQAALEALEREKRAAVQERDDREADVEDLTNQMNKTTAQLQLDVQLLRESNEALVADVLRETQEKIEAQARLEEEALRWRQLDEEKRLLVLQLQGQVAQLEASGRQLARDQQQEMETVRSQNLMEMDAVKEEFRASVKAMERRLADDRDAMSQTHQQELADVREIESERLKLVQQEHRTMLAAKEEREAQHLADIECWNECLNAKETELMALRSQLEQRERQTADDWIQRETALMQQFAETKSEGERRVRDLEEAKRLLAVQVRQLAGERDAAQGEIEVFQVN